MTARLRARGHRSLAGFASSPALAVTAALAFVSATACTRPAPDATPDGAVRAWVDRMEASGDDPLAVRQAYALLGPAAQSNLRQRAERASQVEGRRVDPWGMLAEGRFALTFRPKTLVAKVSGDAASVAVTGDSPLTEHAVVKCVRVPGPPPGWRVEPDLPPLVALPRRDPDPAASAAPR